MAIKAVWTGKELNDALNITSIPGDFTAGRIDFNSKDIKLGEIFIALPGSNRDGHEFIKDAADHGAKAFIVKHDYQDELPGKFYIKVPDTLEALTKLASYKRTYVKSKFIGITGSVGKTSTKEILGHILASFDETFINFGNYNNHLGVPLSLCALAPEVKYSINEMGMNAKGEINYLANLVKPDIAIITQIAEAHLEALGSLEEICRAKCEIFQGVTPGGTVILNRDSEFYDLQYTIAKEVRINNILSFGEHNDADCNLVSYKRENDRSQVVYRFSDQELQFDADISGKHQAVNLAAVLLAVKALGLDLNKAVAAIKNIKPYAGRGLTIDFKVNGKKLTVIDDAYNANPSSVKASLANFAHINAKNKIAILADMLELGAQGDELHTGLAPAVLASGATRLITVGALMQNLAKALEGEISSQHFPLANIQVFDEILESLEDDAIILVKGSKGTKIRSFIDYLIAKQ